MWNCVTDSIKADMNMDTGMSRFILLSAALHLGALAALGYGPVRPAQRLPSALSVTLDAPSGMTATAARHGAAPQASAIAGEKSSGISVKHAALPKPAKNAPPASPQNIPSSTLTHAYADSLANARVDEVSNDSPSPAAEQTREEPIADTETYDVIAQQPAVSYIQHIDSAMLTSRLAGQLRDALAPYFAYPLMARRNGWQGQVRVGLRVEADGRLSHVRIAQSSGYRLLDSAALATLNHISAVPRAAGWLEGRHFDMVLPIDYRLIDGQS